MSEYLYWPYDEVTLKSGGDRKVLVQTPWIEASVQVPLDSQAEMSQLLLKFEKQELGPSDIDLINWFFKNLEGYPLCYILPIPKDASAGDNHQIKGKSFAAATLEEIVSPGLLNSLPRRAFAWDMGAALTFATAGESIHPESAFSVARRYHLLELLENDKGKEVFQKIEKLPKEEFRAQVSRMVRQNLYVTEQCESSLSPAIGIAQSAKSEVEHFIRAERGHDRILSAAMKTLVADPNTIPPSQNVIELMKLLKMTAEKNFLAFSMAVDFFERSSYEKIDPLAKLLQKGGYLEAAKQINRHKEINDEGEHENMGLGFLKHMSLCGREYVMEAFRLAESVSLVMNSVSSSAIE